MSLNIPTQKANVPKIPTGGSLFELNIPQKSNVPKAPKIHVPKITKSSVNTQKQALMTQNFLSLNIPKLKKGAKRKNK